MKFNLLAILAALAKAQDASSETGTPLEFG